MSNLLGNTPLEKAMHDNLQRLGPPPFDDADRAFAAKIQATLTRGGHRRPPIAASACRCEPGVSLCDQIVPLGCASARR